MQMAEQTDPFRGKTALIFGAGRNIGRAIAREFARRGAAVGVADLDAAGAEETAALVVGSGGQAIAIPCDVTESDAIRAAAEAMVSAFGEPDIVMNNAGVLHSGFPEDIPIAEWERTFAVNLFAMARSAEIFMPWMIARGSGWIVNTASFAGAYPYAINRIPYAASKAGVLSFSQNLAAYLAPKGVRVSCLCPGPVMTDSVASMPTFSGDMPMVSPGRLRVKSQEEAATILADGMAAGRMLIPTHEELWAYLRDWAEGPDAFVSAKADAIANGTMERPYIEPN
jgi:NAD(P)-dependent dehydrogenase (short-subunit alcohol dehydrogenase family)